MANSGTRLPRESNEEDVAHASDTAHHHEHASESSATAGEGPSVSVHSLVRSEI